jgi:hypothetical protein
MYIYMHIYQCKWVDTYMYYMYIDTYPLRPAAILAVSALVIRVSQSHHLGGISLGDTRQPVALR